MKEVLNEEDIRKKLKKLPVWKYKNNSIRARYEFNDFATAISFIVRISFICEKFDHHPVLKNIYSSVRLSFSTHDVGNRVTNKDFLTAWEIQQIFENDF